MPFNDQQLKSVTLNLFGGLCTEENPSDLLEGASPDNQDCEFILGSVLTRRGLVSQFPTTFIGNVNYTKTYIQPNLDVQTLFLDNAGNVDFEDVTNFPNNINVAPIGAVLAGCYCDSVTAFGREYMAFSDGKFGIDIPRQYDGINFDRVSQDGPGAAPSVSDSAVGFAIVAGPLGAIESPALAVLGGGNAGGGFVQLSLAHPSNIVSGDIIDVAGVGGGYDGVGLTVASVSSFGVGLDAIVYYTGAAPAPVGGGGTVTPYTVKITTAVGLILSIGQNVTLAGIGVPAYNGIWMVHDIIDATHFHVTLATNGNAPSGGGTILLAGHIPAGLHQVTVMFLTRQGYITRPAPPLSWTAAGNLGVSVSNIPIGPSNVVARILAFTPAGSNFFFYVPETVFDVNGAFIASSFIINDNTTTSVVIDFNDVTLAASISIDSAGNNLFALETLAECLGVIAYADRLAWYGERNTLQNFNNLSFDGGWNGNVPLGWVLDPTSGAGGTFSTTAVWGWSYQITGDGASVNRGMISQSAYQDAYRVPILLPNTKYSVRVRLRQTGAVQGNVVIEIFSPTLGVLGNAPFPIVAASTTFFQEFISNIMFPQISIPPDAVIRVYTNGTFNAGATVKIDNLQIYPTLNPYLNSRLRFSYAINPESFDGVTGNIEISEGEGQAVRGAFLLRENLYMGKDGSLYTTQDNGTTEPSNWQVSTVSNKVGITGPHGVDVGEEWAVIAHLTGVYIFNGSEPLKISQEVSNNGNGLGVCWDSINWPIGYTIWVANDVARRQIYIGVPVGESNHPNRILNLDYKELQTSSTLSSEGPIHTSYSGKVLSWEPGRKWSPWNVRSVCGAMVRRPDGSDQLFIGNAAANGKVYQPTIGQLSDDGVAIHWYYDTYAQVSDMLEQANQLGSNRKLYSFLSLSATGSGTLQITPFVNTISNPSPSYTLALGSGILDLECPIRVAGERCFFRYETNAVGSWGQLMKQVLRLRSHPIGRLRHSN